MLKTYMTLSWAHWHSEHRNASQSAAVDVRRAQMWVAILNADIPGSGIISNEHLVWYCSLLKKCRAEPPVPVVLQVLQYTTPAKLEDLVILRKL